MTEKEKSIEIVEVEEIVETVVPTTDEEGAVADEDGVTVNLYQCGKNAMQ